MASGTLDPGFAYTPFLEDDIVTNNATIVTQNMWSTNIASALTTFFTSSAEVTGSGDYYYDIYQGDPATATSEVQFSIAYGHINGSGSFEKYPDSGIVGHTPSKAIYSQYVNMLLQPEASTFTLNGGTIMTDFVAISFARERLKEALDPGNWDITMNEGAASAIFCDSNTGTVETDVATSYDIVSGSIANGIYTPATPVYVGKAYPKYGILIFDGAALRTAGITIDNTSTNLSDPHSNNNTAVFTALGLGASFKARNKQTLASSYYFARIKNSKYNYSNNPTYTTGSSHQIIFSDWYTNPVTYITTVGLYNDKSELLAVAKLSQPIKKTKETEALIRVQLNF